MAQNKSQLAAGEEVMETEDDHSKSDLLAFITGLLLGTDQNVRTWFSQFIKTGQKVRD